MLSFRAGFSASTATGILLNAALATAADVYTSLEIVNAQISPDGYSRPVVIANNSFPGPLISGSVGDRFLINVTDSLTDESMYRATTVHWHGIFQKKTPEMDGVDGVTQCPIIPGNSFLYNWTAPGQSGTYWYHSHFSTQYCDGLAGPLVIYDPEDPLDYMYDVDDESTIITVSDWDHVISTVAHPAGSGRPPTSNATLVNGKGRYSSGPAADLAVIRAQPGMRHRMRLVNIGCDDYFDISIDNHRMTIIEVDGVETQPYEVDQLRIQSGQRYSVVVDMDQDVDNYWIRALPVGSTDVDGGINSAILRYDGADDCEPKDRKIDNSTFSVMNEAQLTSLVNTAAPGGHHLDGADIVLNMYTNLTSAGTWFINDVVFIPPSVPVLLQILGGNTNANSLLPNGSVYDLPFNKTVEVHINSGNDHPFHLHGANFWLIKPYGSSVYNYETPVQRDVVTTGADAGDEIVFRFVTDNTGPWFLHCHIDWHLQDGLAAVFAMDARDVAADTPDNTDWDNLCPLYNANNPDASFKTLTIDNAY